MLKRSFLFSLFFLTSYGMVQAMLPIVVLPPKSTMRTARSQQDLEASSELAPRRLAMSDSELLFTTPLTDITGAVVNAAMPVKRPSTPSQPPRLAMDDTSSDEVSDDIAGKDLSPVLLVKTPLVLAAVLVASQASAPEKQGSPEEQKRVTQQTSSSALTKLVDEYEQEEIVFPGYIKTIWVKKCPQPSTNTWYESYCCGH